MVIHALEGVKVVDFSWAQAGPLCTKILAIHGATVVKIESSTHPDTCRVYAPMAGNIPGINRCGAFASSNDSKYSLAVKMTHPKGLEVIRRVIAWSDIVVENFSAGVMERHGLGWKELQKLRPNIIMIRISMQGQTGPKATQPGFGTMLQSQAGFTELIGWPHLGPDIIPIALTDHIAPWYTAFLAVAALDWRRRTGRGLYVDASHLEGGVNFLAPAVLDYTANGRVWRRNGNRHQYAAPHGVYRCQGNDRWCAIAVFDDDEWQSFVRVIGEPEWTKSEKFATFLARKKNEDELDKLVEEWTSRYSPEVVMERMQKAKIPAGVVESNKDLFHDPQLEHRHHFWKLKHPETGLNAYDGLSFRMSKTPAELCLPAPCLGEHTSYVCTELLGMAGEEFTQLLAEGIFE